MNKNTNRAIQTGLSLSSKIGYFGPEGSFTHEVAEIMLPNRKLVPFSPTGTGFRLLNSGVFCAIVVPFENSIGGAVPETLDQLLLVEERKSQTSILEQWVFRVNLCLLGAKKISLKTVKRIYTHFVPLQVIRPWLEKKFPDAETVLTSSTSAAARECLNDSHALAVANPAAARVYGLKIYETRLAAPSKNVTRFLLIGANCQREKVTSITKTSDLVRGMLHLRLINRSGALCDALQVFKNYRVNLTQILSRPVAGSPGSHQFLIEWEGRASDNTATWMNELASVTRKCRNLGVYSVHNVPTWASVRSS